MHGHVTHTGNEVKIT